MNVLLTSAGRRNYMVEYFKEALKPYKGKVFAINSDLDSPALWIADYSAKSPLIYDNEYEMFLLNYCVENKINVVISLFDIELPVLSRLKDKFASSAITIIVADTWFTDIANDKWKTYLFLKENNFEVLPTYQNQFDFLDAFDKGLIDFPVYIKPRWGMGSISVFKADNMVELNFYYEKVKKEIQNTYLKYESDKDTDNSILIQTALKGEEYGLDVINDLNGNYCCTIVKKKLMMRSGETDSAITVNEPVLEAIGKKLAVLSKHPANMDVDVFFDGTTPSVLEFNPRFGGGYPFSHQAGVNLPKAIIKWYLNEKIEKELLKPKIGIKSMKGISIITEENIF
ncbi:ATP-grasp domain-containing protein [Flavobacterium piscis]|uniref:Carbamoyl-phosphate synthase large subunit n=1 Tax=Flavobacterium piscis TaxID=1114874 RepID=A0ABU1Y414_9FLAO|nr:ATP-grasp domain-containing protein [Flavobacterium piscis]MDR7208964.1 carbamoyl-phosphate synthase large subunit [Flavobacterium piscis]